MNTKNKFLPVFILLLSLFTGIQAQFLYFPYYGKNKVQYQKFNWSHYQTAHFDIHYYIGRLDKVEKIAELAESAYLRISQEMKHELSAPVPLIYYSTFTDFEQTNLFQISEGVAGVAEPVLYRVAVHGDVALDELADLIAHELTHIFQFDLLWGSPGGALYAVSSPPLWVFEGYAEYNTQKWSSWSSLIVRDAVLNDRIPDFTESGELYSRYPLPREPAYDFGHAIYEFIESQYGKSGIREFWQSLKHAPLIKRLDPIERAFGLKPKEFSYKFKKYLRDKNKEFLTRENPENYSIPLGPEYPLNPYYFAFSHAVSPSGDMVAVLTFNVKDLDIDILLISTKDGEVIKNITRGYTWKYENIKYDVDPSKGKDIAWSPDGDEIAFFGRAGHKHALFTVNVLSGNTTKKIPIPYDQPTAPCFHPKENSLVFTAFDNGQKDVFKIDLTSKKITNLTNDNLYEKAPALSPDGKKIAYTVRLDIYDKLFLSPLSNLKERTQLTFGKGNTITPEFSKDGKTIYFAGDMRDAFNIYSLNLETGELKRYTDVRTGNFFPSPQPNTSNKIVFASFNKGAFQVYSSELEGEVEEIISFANRDPDYEFRQFEPILSLEFKKEKVKPYEGIGKLYLASRPPVEAIVSTDGSIYGGSSIAFTDLLADHTFYIMAYQVQSFRSYYLAYINQRSRLQYMASAFKYTQYYYPDYFYYDPALYSLLSYRDAIATRDISGASIAAYYPFNKYYRAEGSFEYAYYEEDFYDPYLSSYLYLQDRSYGYFWNGNLLSASISLVGETTRFKYYGPAAGHTFKISLSQSIPLAESFFQNTTARLDARKYFYIGFDSLFAFRFNGFISRGEDPFIFYFGGNNQVRSSYYYNIIGNEGWYSNLEFRFPLVNSANTLIGQIGPVRGTLFIDMARSKLKGYPAKFYRFTGDPNNIKEFDAIGSYGFGFQFFFLGLPIHLDFVKKLEFPEFSKPFNFDVVGEWQTKFWIGFDF